MAFTKRPTGGNNQFSGGKRPYDGGNNKNDGKSQFGGDRRPYEGGKKPYEGGKKPYEGGKKPYEGGKKPYEGGKRPYTPGQSKGGRADAEAFSGHSTRPQRQNDQGDFWQKRPGAPGPRPAAPTGKPVPRATKVDEHRPPQKFAQPVAPKPIAPTPPPVQPEWQQDDSVENENILIGRNPIREAIKAGRTIEKLLVANGELSGSARQIVAWAREARIVVQYVDRVRLDQIYPNHQGMIAFTAAAEYKTVDDILNYAREMGEDALILVLDGITDPHNLGAIIRSAECAGAHGIIIPERRSAGLNPAAVKASAGALEYQRVAKVVNLARTIDELKEAGLWVIGADMTGEPMGATNLTGPVALIIGGEGEGISHLLKTKSDKLVSIPMKGKLDSLNASVAAGVLLYEVMRQRSI